MPTRIKICGIREPELAKLAEDLGVHAIGLNFVPNSARYVSDNEAQAISEALGPFIHRVGLFVNPSADNVTHTMSEVDLDILQFHGEEEASFCESFGLPYIKAVRVKSAEDILSANQEYVGACALLLDSHSEAAKGGTGETFDWKLIPEIDKPLILAGGLTSVNVAAAIAIVEPYAVDVSSGVESAPGVKDAARMRAFVDEVNSL